jgi:hypothetical protein
VVQAGDHGDGLVEGGAFGGGGNTRDVIVGGGVGSVLDGYNVGDGARSSSLLRLRITTLTLI